jgi:hypothetical protein
MGISVGIFLFAVGAILRYAVDAQVDGLDLNTVGVVLMVVGLVGALASALFWSSFSPYGRDRTSGPVVRRSEIIREDRV